MRFLDRWNPLSSKIPYTVFTSHILERRKKVHKEHLDIQAVIPELEKAVQEYRRAHGKVKILSPLHQESSLWLLYAAVYVLISVCV